MVMGHTATERAIADAHERAKVRDIRRKVSDRVDAFMYAMMGKSWDMVADAPPAGARTQLPGVHTGCARIEGTANDHGPDAWKFIEVRIPRTIGMGANLILLLATVQRCSTRFSISPTLTFDPTTNEEVWRFS